MDINVQIKKKIYIFEYFSDPWNEVLGVKKIWALNWEKCLSIKNEQNLKKIEEIID